LDQANGRRSEKTKQLTEVQLEFDQLKGMNKHFNQANES
jgi:hypothetical protein